MSTLFELLQPQRITEVVDIGANPIDGDPPYKRMLQLGLCKVTGFEPQQDALERLLRSKGPNERYLPDAIGDGKVARLHICAGSGMTSLLVPDQNRLKAFGLLEALGRVVSTTDIQTTRLDDVDAITTVDLLKMDIQGSELSVLQNGRHKLAETLLIQTEVSFVELYEQQPGIGEIDREMRSLGFIPHAFADVKLWPISPFVMNNNPGAGLNQLLEADLVYCRDFTQLDKLTDEHLKQMALIAHHCYSSFDLSLRCVKELEARSALGADAAERYLMILRSAG